MNSCRNLVLRFLFVALTLCVSSSQVFAAPPPEVQTRSVCSSVPANFQARCTGCFDNNGAWTAIGCISADPRKIVAKLFQFAIGIGGGLAFFLILFGGFQISISAGNPDSINSGKELITGAVAGLLFIIFSLFILRTIGASIVGIPGFK